MISNHFPSTFGNKYQWIVLIAITLGSAGIKHYLNAREKEQLSIWVLPISILLLNRCVSCHSATPTDKVWKVAPNGVKYDTKEQILNLKDKIFQRVVVSKDMPFANQTGMTEKEREIIECWINQNALK